MTAAGPVREGERLFSVAALGGSPVAVLVLHDPAGTAGIPNGWPSSTRPRC